MLQWWAVWLGTDAQLEAEARVRKIEKLKLKKGVWLSTTLLASEPVDKVKSRIIIGRHQCVALQTSRRVQTAMG